MKRLFSHQFALLVTVVVTLMCATPAFAANNRAVYRLYNPNTGEHFYTTNAGERDATVRAGWRNEGVGWTAPSTSSAPVWRLYSGADHHYTMSAHERDTLIRLGWRGEGISFYSDPLRGVGIYRQYNPNASVGAHNFTSSAFENRELVRLGWRSEGVAFYGVDTSNIPVTGIEVKPTQTSLEPGASAQLTATVFPINATNKAVTWSSSDEGIARVDGRGNVVGVSTGIATVTARSSNGRVASCRVTVGRPASEVVSSITGRTVERGQEVDLSSYVSMLPDDTTDALKWTTSNANVATVDASGTVCGIAPGQATITARAGSGKCVELSVYVPREGYVGTEQDGRWATLWDHPLTITSSQARARFSNVDKSVLLQGSYLNVRASLDGREVLAGSTDAMGLTVDDEDWSSVCAGDEGTYAVTTHFDVEGLSTLELSSVVTVVPDDTLVVRETEGDPQESAALFAVDTQVPSGTYLGSEELRSLVGCRAWVSGVEVSPDRVEIVSDGGLAQASLSGQTGSYAVELRVVSRTAIAQRTVKVTVDGPATLTFLTASSTPDDVSYGFASVASQELTSRSTSDAQPVTATARPGHVFVGWYEGVVEQGSEPTADPVSTDVTFTPTRPPTGWQGNTTYTALFRAQSYTLTLDDNGGTGGLEQVSVVYGQTPDVALVTPTRAGYDFTGYYMTTASSEEHVVIMRDGEPVWNGPWILEGDRTAHAGWTPRDDTPYTVRHLREDLAEDGSGLGTFTPFDEATQVLQGTTSHASAAHPLDTTTAGPFEGYTPRAPQNVAVAGDGSTVIDILYDRNTYTFSFEDWESFGRQLPPVTLWHGQTAAAPADSPEDFLSWMSDDKLTTAYDFATPVTSDTTVYASYRASVLVELPDGLGDREVHGTRGSSMTAAQILAGTHVAGYEVTGIYLDASRTQPVESVLLEEDTTVVYASVNPSNTTYTARHWVQLLDPSEHDVVGNFHNETCYELVETQTLESVSGRETNPDPIMGEGYSCQGIPHVSVAGDGSTMVDVYYDRVWVDVTFDANAVGHATVPEGVSVPFGGLVPAAPDAKAQGYFFSGWYEDQESTKAWSFVESRVTSSEAFVLYAGWHPNVDTTYKVRHELQRLVNDQAVDAYDEDAVVLHRGTTGSAATPVVKNYPGFVPQLPSEAKTIAFDGSTELTIRYVRESYVPVFDMQGHGTAITHGSVPMGAHVTRPADPTADGWVFKGWFADAACTDPWDFETDTVPAGGATIHASWAVQRWDVVGRAMYDGLTTMVACGVSQSIGPVPAYVAEEGGWQIESAEQLAYVAYLINQGLLSSGTDCSLAVRADLGMSGSLWNGGSVDPSDALLFQPVALYEGTLDGCGHTLIGMRVEGEGPCALIAHVSETTAVTRLGVSNYRVISASGDKSIAAALVAAVDDNAILALTDCFAIGTSHASSVSSGLVGTCGEGASVLATNCYVVPRDFVATVTQAVAPSSATLSNCYFEDMGSSFAPADEDPFALARRSQTLMRSDGLAYALNQDGVGATWTRADDTNEGYPTFGTMPDKDLVTVALENGDADTGLDHVTIIRGELAAGIVQAPTRMGYDFGGYYTQPAGEGTCYVDAQAAWQLPVAADGLELTAKWVPRDDTPYTVRHWQQRLNEAGTDVAGTEHSAVCYELVEGDTQTLVGTTEDSTAAVAKTYEGFHDLAIEQKEIIGRGTTVVDVYYDRTYYDVTLNLNGPTASVPPTSPVAFGASVPAPRNPVAANYTFEGWYKEESCQNAWSFTGQDNPDGMPAGGVTLHACWSINSWQVVGRAMFDGVDTLRVRGTDTAVGDMPTYDATKGWIVQTPEQLACVAYMTTNRKISPPQTPAMTLAADIDLAGVAWGGTEEAPLTWTPIVGFAGTLDGGSHVVSNMYAHGSSYAALISSLAGESSIRSLTMVDARAEGAGGYKAALVATVTGQGLTLTDVGSVNGSVRGTSYPVAGLVASISDGSKTTLERCFAQGGVVSTTESTNGFYVAGLVGSVLNSTSELLVDNCYSTTAIHGKTVHGLVGQNYVSSARPCGYTTVTNSYFAGTLEHSEDGGAFPIASNNARIVRSMQNCYYDSDKVPDAVDPTFFGDGLTPVDTLHLKDKGSAWELNGRAFGEGVAWTQSPDANDGYPAYGELAGPTHQVTLSPAPLEQTPETVTVIAGGMRIQRETVPTRVGYTFDGFVDKSEPAVTYVDKDGVWAAPWDKGEDDTLWASWTPKTYHVTLDDGEGTGGSGEATATYDEPLGDVTIPIWEGHSFLGYYDAQDEGGTKYVDATGSGVVPWDIDADEGVTLYARWKTNAYTVSFDGNGAASVPPDQQVDYGGQALLDNTAFTRTGYELLGWSVTADATEPDEFLRPVSEEPEATATWPASVTLTREYLPSLDVSDEGSEGHVATVTLYAVWAPSAPQLTATYDLALPATDMFVTCSLAPYADHAPIVWDQTSPLKELSIPVPDGLTPVLEPTVTVQGATDYKFEGWTLVTSTTSTKTYRATWSSSA